MAGAVLIVDDNPAVRCGLSDFMRTRTEWKVCGEAGDGRRRYPESGGAYARFDSLGFTDAEDERRGSRIRTQADAIRRDDHHFYYVRQCAGFDVEFSGWRKPSTATIVSSHKSPAVRLCRRKSAAGKRPAFRL